MAVPELLDQPQPPVWQQVEPSKWDLLTMRSMLLRMLQLKRDAGKLDTLRKRINEQYQDQVVALDNEYQELRGQVKRFITEFNNGENIKLPDVGTAFIQNKNAAPSLKLANQEAAYTEVGSWDEEAKAAVHRQVFDPQAYLARQKETVEAILQGAAKDAEGQPMLTDDGTGVVQTTGEIVQLPPGLVLQRPEAVLALRPA